MFMEEHGLRARSVNTPGPTLEDVFVKLTSEEQEVGSSQ